MLWSQVWRGRPDRRFQSLGKGTRLAWRARLLSTDGSVRAVWPKNFRLVCECQWWLECVGGPEVLRRGPSAFQIRLVIRRRHHWSNASRYLAISVEWGTEPNKHDQRYSLPCKRANTTKTQNVKIQHSLHRLFDHYAFSSELYRLGFSVSYFCVLSDTSLTIKRKRLLVVLSPILYVGLSVAGA